MQANRISKKKHGNITKKKNWYSKEIRVIENTKEENYDKIMINDIIWIFVIFQKKKKT